MEDPYRQLAAESLNLVDRRLAHSYIPHHLIHTLLQPAPAENSALQPVLGAVPTGSFSQGPCPDSNPKVRLRDSLEPIMLCAPAA